MKTDPNCIFCKIVSGEIPSHKVYEDDISFAFLDLNPINPGHTLLIPKLHEDSFWDLDDKNYHYIMDVAKKLQATLQRTYSPPRVALVVEGFGVAHAHLHIVPIHSGEDLKKSQPPAEPEELEKEAQKIRANL